MKNKKPMTVADAGRRGGKARAKKLTPERRKEIATKASRSRPSFKKKNNHALSDLKQQITSLMK